MSDVKHYGDTIMVGERRIPISWGVEAGGFVFVSGMVAVDENWQLKLDGDLTEQTHLVMQGIERVLAMADCEMKDIVRSQVYLKNASDSPLFDELYGGYFGDKPPTRCGCGSLGVQVTPFAHTRWV
ncbi:MAG: RidA family protein [Gammaproteobacteria bacterium]|nr:RidA family protein [Gammaproteobacteria bacterium]